MVLGGLVDLAAEGKRLEKELTKAEKELAGTQRTLSNEGFVAKAPAAVVEGEKVKLAKYKENLDGVETALSKLK